MESGVKYFIFFVGIISVIFLVGCDPCYFREGENLKVVGRAWSNESNWIHNDTCDTETFWEVVNTKSGCTLRVLSYKYDSCSEKDPIECLDRDNPPINLKGIYGKVKVYGDYGMMYYDITPYACAGN